MLPIRINLNEGELLAIIGSKGAGKSTFLKVLLNINEDNEYFRKIFINDEQINVKENELQKFLIDFRATENLIPSLSVAENIFLGRQFTGSLGKINWNKLYFEAGEVLNELGITSINYDTPVKDLTLFQKLLVVIARVYSRKVNYFIFDEITHDLDKAEVFELYCIINKLKKLIKTIIYVPYRIEEISQIADKVAIFYKGDLACEILDMNNISYERIINIMMGQEKNSNPFTDLSIETFKITEREKEIILLVANGFSNTDISERLDISLGTVKNHIYNIFQKTNVKNRNELCNILKIR